MPTDEKEKLVLGNGGSDGQSLQQIQDFIPVPDITAGQFPDDLRVASYLGIEKQCLEPVVARAQMIDPDGSINEDHN